MKHKTKTGFFAIALISATVLCTYSCKKEGQKQVPAVTTTAVTNITASTATGGGYVTSDGGSEVTERGVCIGTGDEPSTADSKLKNGKGVAGFTSSITGLSASTTYHLRAYASNSVGTAYGNLVSFRTTYPTLPILTTAAITGITQTNATCGGNITTDGGMQITARGVCWSKNPIPLITDNKTNDGEGPGIFVSYISGLSDATDYYVRAYATTSLGTTYGNIIAMQTHAGLIMDADGNMYATVRIGNQVCMRSNLKTTKYRDSTEIPNITDNATWYDLSTGAYCYYADLLSNKEIYGALYNFHAVANNRQLCPTGWHVPGNDEWETLVNYLGGQDVAGGALKATTLWANPNTGATNSSGFTALPGGRTLGEMGVLGVWWTSSTSEYVIGGANSWDLLCDRKSILSTTRETVDGLSVRCIRN